MGDVLPDLFCRRIRDERGVVPDGIFPSAASARTPAPFRTRLPRARSAWRRPGRRWGNFTERFPGLSVELREPDDLSRVVRRDRISADALLDRLGAAERADVGDRRTCWRRNRVL